MALGGRTLVEIYVYMYVFVFVCLFYGWVRVS